ncbi:hypothetical protein MIR68_009825 [Amoeboaphelidium protococcarum]|nr:hypothetical protein MIR68_009825 [Amoeboaphelidium protococcarum]
MLKVQTLLHIYSLNLLALHIYVQNVYAGDLRSVLSSTCFGEAALARVCYFVSACWAFRKAPPPSPLITISAA